MKFNADALKIVLEHWRCSCAGSATTNSKNNDLTAPNVWQHLQIEDFLDPGDKLEDAEHASAPDIDRNDASHECGVLRLDRLMPIERGSWQAANVGTPSMTLRSPTPEGRRLNASEQLNPFSTCRNWP